MFSANTVYFSRASLSQDRQEHSGGWAARQSWGEGAFKPALYRLQLYQSLKLQSILQVRLK
jgi:hypothetical protein